MNKENFHEYLSTGLKQLGVSLSLKTQSQLIHYLELLQQWNKTYNLTAISDMPTMVTHHLLDSLSIMSCVKGDRVLDVGTGAGLPGIPLALAYPNKQWVLLDSRGKKIQFLSHVKQQLGLSNVTIVESRVEKYQDTRGFDNIVVRAVADLATIWKLTQHLLTKEGRVLAMKGQYPSEELVKLSQESARIQTQPLAVPGLDAKRCIVIICQKELSND